MRGCVTDIKEGKVDSEELKRKQKNVNFAYIENK